MERELLKSLSEIISDVGHQILFFSHLNCSRLLNYIVFYGETISRVHLMPRLLRPNSLFVFR